MSTLHLQPNTHTFERRLGLTPRERQISKDLAVIRIRNIEQKEVSEMLFLTFANHY